MFDRANDAANVCIKFSFEISFKFLLRLNSCFKFWCCIRSGFKILELKFLLTKLKTEKI